MGKIPMTYSEDTLTFIVNGLPYQADSSMVTFEDVKDELKKADPDPERLIALVQPAQAIAKAFEEVDTESVDYLPRGVVSVTRNAVLYNGEPIGGVLVDRILSMIEEGFDMMPMVRFLENLYTNPADFARDELYLWLEACNLPITEDGYFLAYKRVNGNFTSVHDGRTRNDIGTIVSIPRESVDTVRAHTCSTGLHFCSAAYLPHFSGAKVVLLKINPADVVSIPNDYNNAKGRAWKYEVLSEVDFDAQTKAWPTVVSPNAGTAAPKAVAPKGFDPGSQEAKHLFSLLNQIGLQDRDDRLDWAFDVLTDESEDYMYSLESFNDLTDEHVEILTERAEADVAEMNAAKARSAIAAAPKVDARKEAEKARINGLGIIALRREASKAGLPGAWKGPSGDSLRAYLISKL
jgi:hypothetical protein